MTLSAVSNSIIAKNQASLHKAGTTTEQAGGDKSNLSAGGDLSGNKHDDTVSLRQVEKNSGSAVFVSEKEVDQMLPRTKAAILQDSKIAVAVQANINSQAAQEYLSEK